MKSIVLYGFPFAADIIVSLVLFVGRHSLASRGYDEVTVGSILLFYGIGYVIASLLMTKIIKPAYAKVQMLGALACVVAVCIILANVEQLRVVQALYCIFPFAISLYFNAFQVFMLGITQKDDRPLASLAGHFTLSWSMGFAVGPFISSLLKTVVTWAQITYVAAALAALIGFILYRFDPVRHSGPGSEQLEAEGEVVVAQRSLIGPTWLGLLFGWTMYNVILIFWPVQAVQRAIPANLRGMVEFVSATAQGLSALALVSLRGWHHKPGWLVRLGGLGVVGLVILGTVDHTAGFIVAALLYGTYTGSMFSLVVYHSMLEESKAVQRIALNEVVVGISFLISSPVAKLVHAPDASFGGAYTALAVVLAVGVLAQSLYAAILVRRDTAPALEREGAQA